jgi:hypothetical protein
VVEAVMDVLFSWVPLLVGSIFFALGGNMILHFFRFRARSTRVPGRVVAIEKYLSQGVGSQNRNATQVYFRPLVEFVFEGVERKTFGASVNEVRHKLGQQVDVLVNADPHSDGIQAMLDDKLRVFVGAIFSLFGLGALVAYLFSAGGSAPLAAGVALVAFLAGHAITTQVLDFATSFSRDDDAQPKKDSTLITTPEAFKKEVSSHGFWGAIIAWSFMLLSIGIIMGGLKSLPAEAQQLLSDDWVGFIKGLTEGKVKSTWKGPLALTGAGLFFFLASIRSVYYVHKKYGGLLRR